MEASPNVRLIVGAIVTVVLLAIVALLALRGILDKTAVAALLGGIGGVSVSGGGQGPVNMLAARIAARRASNSQETPKGDVS